LRSNFIGKAVTQFIEVGRLGCAAIGRLASRVKSSALSVVEQVRLSGVRAVSWSIHVNARCRSATTGLGSRLRIRVGKLADEAVAHPSLSTKAAAWVITVLFFLYAVLLSLQDFYTAMFAIMGAGMWLSLCWIASSTRRRKPRRRESPARTKWETLLIIMVVATSWATWTRARMLQYQLSDVIDNLKLDGIPAAGAEDKPMETFFKVTNDSHFDISTERILSCKLNFAILDHRPFPVQTMYSAQIPAGLWMFSGGPLKPEDQGVLLNGHGDAESIQCMGLLHTNAVDCLDATVIYSYYLVAQPKVLQEKQWHMIAKHVPGSPVRWYQEPSGGGSYGNCIAVYPPPPPSS
jgi:hypothetical protein